MRDELIEHARVFVESLFVNGGGETATRLLLWDDAIKRDLGGWSRAAIVDRLADFHAAERNRQYRELKKIYNGTCTRDPITAFELWFEKEFAAEIKEAEKR